MGSLETGLTSCAAHVGVLSAAISSLFEAVVILERPRPGRLNFCANGTVATGVGCRLDVLVHAYVGRGELLGILAATREIIVGGCLGFPAGCEDGGEGKDEEGEYRDDGAHGGLSASRKYGAAVETSQGAQTFRPRLRHGCIHRLEPQKGHSSHTI